jgi:hypothetical protein
MRRHAPSWPSLIVGVTFCAIAIAYLSAAIDDRTLQARWMLPVLLIGLGIAGIAATVLRAVRLTPTAKQPDTDPTDIGGPAVG